MSSPWKCESCGSTYYRIRKDKYENKYTKCHSCSYVQNVKDEAHCIGRNSSTYGVVLDDNDKLLVHDAHGYSPRERTSLQHRPDVTYDYASYVANRL